MHSKIEKMMKMAAQLRRHMSLLLNGFHTKGRFSSGIVESFNTKAKLTTRKSYGFKTYHTTEVALYHAFGAFTDHKKPKNLSSEQR